MSKQSKRRREARQKGPLFTTPIQEKSGNECQVLKSGSPKQVSFLAAYALCGIIGRAAKAAGCDRESHHYWMANDPAYPAKFAAAQDAANEMLEAEARRRATQGVERLKFHKGELIMVNGKPYVENDYSDRLLEFLLRGEMHDKYAERKKVETSGSMTILDPELQAGLIDLGNMSHEAEPIADPVDEEPDGTGLPS